MGKPDNAAANIEFPLVLIVAAVSMTPRGASVFSLYLERREEKVAKELVGNSLMLMLLFGIGLCCVSLLFLRPLLIAFGGRGQTLEYVVEYTHISAVGIPFSVLGTGVSQFIRADGSSRYSMVAVIGKLVSTVLVISY